MGFLDGVLELIPGARVGFAGLYRDEETLEPVQYYFKVPDALEDRLSLRWIRCWQQEIPLLQPSI